MIQELRTKIRLMDSFNWIQSPYKILMKNTNKPWAKNSTRENTDLFVKKISETRLIGYQDNTSTHINDLITEKAKGPKKFSVGLSGFIIGKDNSDVASKITKSSFVLTTEEFHFFKLYITLALLTSSFFFSLVFAIDYFFIKILFFYYIIIKQNSFIYIIIFLIYFFLHTINIICSSKNIIFQSIYRII